MMSDDGRGQAEICEILGLPKRRINILRRCYYALEQMRRDNDFGDQVKPSLFSTFDEIFRLPRVRDWLEWDNAQNMFLNEERRKLLYSWLVGSEDDNGQRQPPKIADPKEIRKLPQLMADEIQFKRFSENPGAGTRRSKRRGCHAKTGDPVASFPAQQSQRSDCHPSDRPGGSDAGG